MAKTLAGRILHEVEPGLDAIDPGDVQNWDPEAIKEEGRRILAQRLASA